jgi:hypothetical protein
MSNFILVTQLVRQGYAAAKKPCRVNAEKILAMEPLEDKPEGTKIFLEGMVLRVEEDINSILFRITQGEKQ